MNFNEAAVLFDGFPDLIPGFSVRGDGCANSNAAVFGDFAGYKPDSADIDIAMFLGKAEFAG